MDRLVSEQAVLENIDTWVKSSEPYDGNGWLISRHLYDRIKAIPSAEPKDSEDKIIRRTLENFMRGLWEEIQVGELEYTTSEVYEMLEREIFTDNHVAIQSAEPKTGHWIEDEYEMEVRCSECNEENDECSNYCPNCGSYNGG